MSTPRIPIPLPEIEAFCKKWKITEFSLFGSVLRDDFGPGSDVDVLVEFADDSAWKLGDWIDMEDELASILGREVDLLVRSEVVRMENWIRRKSILEGASNVYAR
ncbi:nucleotidyltransferase domain-containing protein [bacterium]|nr:nucleotidyltransferase domain-containing protein [bacterium]